MCLKPWVGPILFRLFAPLSRRRADPAYRLAALLIAAALAGGCATPPQTRQLLDNPPDLPRQVELEEVPFFPQTEFHCGPAALASVVSYRGIDADPVKIANLIYVPDLQGSLQAEVIAAARQFELLPIPLDGRIESILREIAEGNPVFVLQNLGLDSLPSWHYEVVIGYDLDQGDVILRSGEHRRIWRSFPLFERTWSRAGHWALAVVPANLVPVTASERDFIDTVIDMEQVGRIETAHRGYLTAARRWPKSVIAHSGVGNTAFAFGDFDAAESAYRAALQLEPDRADVWNNLAYALAGQGRYEAATEAIQQALALDPDNQNFQESYNELVNEQ